MKVIPSLVLSVLMLLVGCKEHPVQSPVPCDTCQKCDTCNSLCDTCNKNPDSLKHAFTWTESTIAGENALSGCWVFGPNKLWVIGGSVHVWDGSKWTIPYVRTNDSLPRNGTLADCGFFAFDEHDSWFCTGGMTMHMVNYVMQEYRLPDIGVYQSGVDGRLHACWGTSSKDMFFVGEKGTIIHYDGKDWINYPKFTQKDFYQVWGSGPNDVWASGHRYTTGISVLAHFDGANWSEVDLSSVSSAGELGLIGAWSLDELNKHVDYTCGALVYHRINGGNWTPDTLENTLEGGGYAPLNFIRGNSDSDLMVAGSSGFVSHWNGKSWKLFKEIYDYNDGSFDTYAFSFKGNTAITVGRKKGGPWLAIGQRK